MFYIKNIICFLFMSSIVGISALPPGFVNGLELPPKPSLSKLKNKINITKYLEPVTQAATQYWKTFNAKKEGCMRKLRKLKKTTRTKDTQPEPELLFWDQFGEAKKYINGYVMADQEKNPNPKGYEEVVVISDDINPTLTPAENPKKKKNKIKKIVQKIYKKKPNAKVFSFDPSQQVSISNFHITSINSNWSF